MYKIVCCLVAVFLFSSCGEIYIDNTIEEQEEQKFEIIPRDIVIDSITVIEDKK